MMIVAGTGHRPDKLGGYSDEAHEKLVAIAAKWLTENQPTKVISGMALGWDIALADAAVRTGIPLHAAIPFEGQESRWPQASRDRFNHLRSRATEETIVSDGAYAPWKMQVRNVWMVDNCDTVLAMWDGSSGGTGNCVAYANKVSKPLVNLYGEYND